MKKKIYYLMLLLCLSLLPMRAYAIDSVLNDNDNTNLVGNENELGNGNNLENNNNLENDNEQGNDNEEDLPMAVVTYPEVFVINNASLDLVANEYPTFTATVPEDANYSLGIEYWANAWDTLFYTSDSDTNNYLSNNNQLINPFTFEEFYYYHVALTFYGEEPVNEDDFSNYPFVLNGEEVEGWLDKCEFNAEEHLIYVSYLLWETTPSDNTIEIIDSLEINDANMNVTDGHTPLYGASINDQNVDLLTEWWYTHDEENDTYLSNYSDSTYALEDEELFQFFEQRYRYTYALFVLPKTGYSLNAFRDENQKLVLPASVNGEEKKNYNVYKYYKDQSLVSYILYIDKSVVPVSDGYDVVENGDSTINKSDGRGILLRTNGSHEKYTGVYVDGKRIESETAIDSKGHSIVSLTSTFIETLDVGVHEVAITYSDGLTAYTTLIITDDVVEETNNNPIPTNTVTTNYVATTLTTTSVQEKKEEVKTEEEKEHKDEIDEIADNNIGLWIGLIVLGLVAIGIFIAVYKKDE